MREIWRQWKRVRQEEEKRSKKLENNERKIIREGKSVEEKEKKKKEKERSREKS